MKQKLTVQRLAKLSGEDFDRHKDPDVKAFAAKALPTLKKHFQMAETAGQQVKATSAKK